MGANIGFTVSGTADSGMGRVFTGRGVIHTQEHHLPQDGLLVVSSPKDSFKDHWRTDHPRGPTDHPRGPTDHPRGPTWSPCTINTQGVGGGGSSSTGTLSPDLHAGCRGGGVILHGYPITRPPCRVSGASSSTGTLSPDLHFEVGYALEYFRTGGI